jgi:hypothetical protein
MGMSEFRKVIERAKDGCSVAHMELNVDPPDLSPDSYRTAMKLCKREGGCYCREEKAKRTP